MWRCRLASDRRGGMDATLLNRKKKKEEFFKMTKSVGYVTADVIDSRLAYNERGLPYSLNDRAVAYKRERECARVALSAGFG